MRGFAERNKRRHGDACCASSTASAPDLRTSHTRAAAPARGAVHPRLRPALPVHPRGRHRRRARARGRATTCRASTTSPATGCWRCRRSLAARQAAGARAAAVGDGRWRRAASASPACACPTRCAAAALRPRPRQPQAQGRGLRAALHDARGRAALRRGAARARAAGAARPRIATSARWRSSCAAAPSVAAAAARRLTLTQPEFHALRVRCRRLPRLLLDAPRMRTRSSRSHLEPARRPAARRHRRRLRVRPRPRGRRSPRA